MAEESWPAPGHNSRSVTDLEYEKLAARFSDDGVDGTPADAPVVTAGGGLAVSIRPNVNATVRGHAWTSGGTALTLSVDVNGSGSTRTDWVVLRLDRATWAVTAAIRKGTPGAGAPALVQDTGDTGLYEIPLALVTLPGGAGSVTVKRAELYVGTRVRPCTSTTRNPSPTPGELGYETDTGRTVQFTGKSWRTITSSSGVINVNSLITGWGWEIATDSVLEERNGNVHLRLGSFTRTASMLAGATASRLPVLIPAAYQHRSRDQYAIAYVTGLGIARLTIHAASTDKAGEVWITQHPDIHNGDSVLNGTVSWVVD
ncbi:hypothetical protein ACR9VJ_18075 [Streptomyces sp. H49]|uniref:hypothetical protein n=1 Tax=Streptomyces sp. H49 TaxID=3444117 RepID=UPI003F4AB84A